MERYIYRICNKQNSVRSVSILFLQLGIVIDLSELLKIKLKTSQPYYPQSQGKVERSHATWKNGIEFDMKQGNSKPMII